MPLQTSSTYYHRRKELQAVLGIDVSKHQIDCCVLKDEGFRVERSYPNRAPGYTKIINLIKGHAVELVVLEASGGYEQEVVDKLRGQGIRVEIAKPNKIRHYAKGIGKIAKTDRIDAYVIARFAHAYEFEKQIPLTPEEAELKDYVIRREELKGLIRQEENRLEHATGALRKSINRVLKSLKREFERIEKMTQEKISSSAELCEKNRVLQKYPGVGPVSSAAIITLLPELGRVMTKKVGPISGTSPVTRESGIWKGKRFIQGGRGRLRQILYMGAMAAVLCNPVLGAFYKRLKLAGKSHKAAIVAVIHKMLRHLNAILREYYQGLEKRNQRGI